MDLHALQATLKEIVHDYREISLVYLFGSQVSQEIGPLSDLDLAVLVDPGTDEFALQSHLAYQLGNVLHIPVDILILNRTQVELAYAVIVQGINLFQRSLLEKVEYEATVMSLYGDYLPVLRAQRQDILKGGQDAARVQRYREAFRRTERTLGEVKTTYQ